MKETARSLTNLAFKSEPVFLSVYADMPVWGYAYACRYPKGTETWILQALKVIDSHELSDMGVGRNLGLMQEQFPLSH